MKKLILFLIFGLVLTGPLQAQTPVTTWQSSPESKLWLSGTSTLHDYESHAAEFQISGVFEEGFAAQDLTQVTTALRSARLVVDVKGLKSDKEKLDKKLYKAMRADKHGQIIFSVHKAALEPINEGLPPAVTLVGSLKVAGVAHEVVIGTVVSVEAADQLKIHGSYMLNMEDYGVKPPKMFFGALRTNKMVTIHFDIVLVPAGAENSKT